MSEGVIGFGMKTETFGFFGLRFCGAYRSAYDSDFLFWQSLKRSYDSYSDFAAVSFITVFFFLIHSSTDPFLMFYIKLYNLQFSGYNIC